MKNKGEEKASEGVWTPDEFDPPPLIQGEGVLPPLTAQHRKSLSPTKLAKATHIPKPRFCFSVV